MTTARQPGAFPLPSGEGAGVGRGRLRIAGGDDGAMPKDTSIARGRRNNVSPGRSPIVLADSDDARRSAAPVSHLLPTPDPSPLGRGICVALEREILVLPGKGNFVPPGRGMFRWRPHSLLRRRVFSGASNVLALWCEARA